MSAFFRSQPQEFKQLRASFGLAPGARDRNSDTNCASIVLCSMLLGVIYENRIND